MRDRKKTLELKCEVYFYLGLRIGSGDKFGSSEPFTIIENAAILGFGSVVKAGCLSLMDKLAIERGEKPWETQNKQKPERLDEVIAMLIRMIHPNCSDDDVKSALDARGTRTARAKVGVVEENAAGDLADAMSAIVDPSDAAVLEDEFVKARKRRRKAQSGDPGVSEEEQDSDEEDVSMAEGQTGDAAPRGDREAPERRPAARGADRRAPVPSAPLPDGMLTAKMMRGYLFLCKIYQMARSLRCLHE